MQEVLLERLKKHGEATPLGLFMRAETSLMTDAITAITTDLQVFYTQSHCPCMHAIIMQTQAILY